MMVIWAYILLTSVWHDVLGESNVSDSLNFATEECNNFLVSIVGTHYAGACMNIRFQNGNSSDAILVQQDLVNDLIRCNAAECSAVVSYGDLPHSEGRPAFYNVFLVQDYASLCNLLDGMSYEAFHFHGVYTIVVQELSHTSVQRIMEKLWNVWIINVAVIGGGEQHEEPIAYSYDPYREGECGIIKPIEIGRYVDGGWSSPVADWFPDRTANFHGCPLKVGVVDLKPFSMLRQEGNQTVHFGLEVHIARSLASWLNFTIQFEMPKDSVKWGNLQTENSTGLVGMIQRREVAFGFGCLGLSISRNTYLKWSTPNHMTQMIIAIPPKRPYTSLEKLFQPFTTDAWVCIVVGYTTFGLVTLVLLKLNRNPARERLPNPLYTLWVLLMGGSSAQFRMDSWRIFIIGFIINTLIVRTLYQAGMFERLQASAPLASDLNTLHAINKAGLYYTMYRPTMQFFKDNPMVPNSHIRLVQNDSKTSDELYYDLSKNKLDGVIALPLDCTAYYVKQNGKRGVVYIGKHTGFTYNIGMHFPKESPLQEPFNAWIHQLHASGLTRFWTEEFRDNRYWTNAKEKPEPASLKWNQISGGFLLCGVSLVIATLVFFGELIYFHLSYAGSRSTVTQAEKGD